MEINSVNFGFMKEHDEELERIIALAELNLNIDPNTSLIKIRQFAERLAQLIAIKLRMPNVQEYSQYELLQALQRDGFLSGTALDFFHSIRKTGNVATHGTLNDKSSAIDHLSMCLRLAEVYHRAIGGKPEFDAGKLNVESIPKLSVEVVNTESEAIEKENENLKKKLDELIKSQEKVESEVITTRKTSFREYCNLDLSEDETRKRIIDEKIRSRGWEVDTTNLRYSKGTRPEAGRNLVISEWPTESGPSDYAFFIGEKLVAVTEAKKWDTNVQSDLGQAERYSKGIKSEHQEYVIDEWSGGFKVPLIFSTNGRPYIKQDETRSGIWFRDVRSEYNNEKALVDWFSPRDIQEKLKKDIEKSNFELKNDDVSKLPLREYQKHMIEKVDEALLSRDRESVLVAMATGTGKTRTAICMAYRFIKTKRFNRILFLVDRTSLGKQAFDSFGELKLNNLNTFADEYNIEGLQTISPEDETKVHFATVQGLVKRILYPGEETSIPDVGQYDCIIVDECHRGYTLDKELDEEEFTYRDQRDFLSSYRSVLDYFDATKIGLTATPAAHTSEIFGPPVAYYTFEQAVSDGYLVDRDPEVIIQTELTQAGIVFTEGESVEVYDPEEAEIDTIVMDDEVQINVDGFNTKVVTRAFNEAVVKHLVEHERVKPFGHEKTIVFCARDDHADLVVTLFKEQLNTFYGDDCVPNDTVMKITSRTDRVEDKISMMKNETLPNIIVTVDLLTTGIDVPEITNIVFLRMVKSRILFEQMLGRATRLCPEIDKDSFKVYDAVGVCRRMRNSTTMKPVVKNPKITFTDLCEEKEKASEDKVKDHIVDQIIAKFQAKKKYLKDQKLEEFKSISGFDSSAEFIKELKTKKGRTLFGEDIAKFLDNLKDKKTPILIHNGSDEVTVVEVALPGEQSPEDYLESFKTFVRDRKDELDLINTIASSPKSLKKKDLIELYRVLRENKFTEPYLEAAAKELKGEQVGAKVLGFLRDAVSNDSLISVEERVNDAVEKIIEKYNLNADQAKWIKKIAQQYKRQEVVDSDSIRLISQLKHQGGTPQRLNKVFDDNLEGILSDLNGFVWGRS
jgi:type I restriction enzyme R subunit